MQKKLKRSNADVKEGEIDIKKQSKFSSSTKRLVPPGRTLSTYDHFLGRNKKSKKKRPVAVIESNKRNELAVVSLSSRDGKHRTNLKGYQDGKSYFKHFVEIEDNEGKPIKVGEKFRENHPKLDLSKRDVNKIRKKVLEHSSPAPENRKKMEKFRK